MLLLCIVIFCLLVILGAACAIAETALFSLSPSQLHEMARVEDTRSNIAAKIACKPRELIVILLCLNIAVNILVQNVASEAFTDGDNLWIQVGLPFMITFCCSDLLPKVMALQHNQLFSILTAPWVYRLMQVAGPLIPMITKLAGLVSRYLFFFLRSRPAIDSRKLIKVLGDVSRQDGLLDTQEKRLIEGLVELQESKAHDVMWPRTEILYYNIEDPIDKLFKLIVNEECGKIPVCQGCLDHVLGVLYTKDLLDVKPVQIDAECIKRNLRKALFVPESMPAVRLLRQLDDAYQSMALVVDEYGNVSGLLTREDLLEVVVGEIIDRRDHKNRYVLTSDGSILASGKWELDQVEAFLGLNLTNPHDMQTLGGWITSLSGNIPAPGSRWVFGECIFEVLNATSTHVKKVLIQRLSHRGESSGST